jgi:protocatechuate 3,4-dioxygenase beta subunit
MFTICSLLVALSVGQPSQASTTADQAGRISGRVTLEGANTPIAGARIMLMPTARPTGPMGMPPQAVTDQDGRYVFDRVAPGTYRIDVQKTGLAPLMDPPRGPDVQVGPGQSVDGVDRRLQKGAVIAGRILAPNGEPMPDARIMVLRRMPGPSAPAGLPSRLIPAPGQSQQQTNDLGEFRVSGLAPGEYYVAAMPRPTAMFGGPGGNAQSAPQATRTPSTTIATTFYPGTTDQAAAQPLSVAAGADVGNINFAMQAVPAFRVSGTVVDENGAAVAGAMVMLMGDPRTGGMFLGPSGNARTQDNGRFDLDEVPAGTYRANASIPITMTSSGSSGGGFVTGSWSSASGSATSSFSSISTGGVSGTMEQAAEVVVTDADVTGVRVVVRRPVPR